MKRVLILPLALAAVFAGGATRIVQDQCGPFTDVTPAFCPYILELYYLGITAGTSATTFSPDDPLTRGQGAVFIAKGLNQSLARSSRRAALGQWWTTTPHWDIGLGVTPVGDQPNLLQSDGADIWVASTGDGTVSRVRASDGSRTGIWSGASGAQGLLIAMGRVFVTGLGNPGFLYAIDPNQPGGTVGVVVDTIPGAPFGVAFDGNRIWTANLDGSISLITPATTAPWPFTTVTTGLSGPIGLVYDGAYMWATDFAAGTLLKLDANAAVLQTLPVGNEPTIPVFDGANIWVPNGGEDSVTIVSAATSTVITTLTGNGLVGPFAAAFDGQRVLVTFQGHPPTDTSGIALFRASDFAPLGNFSTSHPRGVCSDGIHFWVALSATQQVGRY